MGGSADRSADRRSTGWALGAVTTGYLLLGLDLGLFYNYTYFGHAVVPLPHPVACAAAFWYYIALGQGWSQAAQAWLWMAAFPLVGWCWLGAAGGLARRWVPQVTWRRLAWADCAGLGLLLLPLPWLAWGHAQTPAGPSWHQFIHASLYRTFAFVPPHLNALYLALAAAGAGLELALLARLARVRRRVLVAWLLSALGLTATLTATSAELVGSWFGG